MLSMITWWTFLRTLGIITMMYYATVGIYCYWNEIRAFLKRRPPRTMLLLLSILWIGLAANAQTADGNNGISQANTMVRGYFETAVQLLYAVGAIVGLMGAYKVFNSIQARDGHAGSIAIGWFGSCLFLVVSATVIKSFFGIS